MERIYHLCSVLTFFIICSKLSSAAETKLTMKFVFDHLSRRLDNLAFEIHSFRMDSQKRMEDMDTKIKDNIPLRKPDSSEILDKGQIQREINQEMEKHANVIHRMLSAEKKAMYGMRVLFSNQWKNVSLNEHRILSINKSCADLRTDFDSFEDAINTKVGELSMKLDSVEKYTIKGEKGEPGQSGSDRYAGIRGPPGIPGRDGLAGPPGPTGNTGPKGEKGQSGYVGEPGRDGLPGLKGPQGNTGPKGDKGDEGPAHKLSQTPLSGRNYVVGPPGVPGTPGIKGERGESGLTGPHGLPGLSGLPGFKGELGKRGPKGHKGDKGSS